MHTVRHVQRGPGGRPIERTDPCGAVFAPSPARGIRAPVYAMGFPDSNAKEPVFTCPVSAVADEVWQLYALWRECRALGALPLEGGVCDQPLSVRRAFPIFDSLSRAEESQRQAALVIASQAAMVRSIFGGRR